MFAAIVEFAFKSNNIGSLIAGLIVIILSAVSVFLIRDIFKKPPSFSGVFYLKTTTTLSSMENYKGLSSFYMMTLINESATRAIGKVEKIYDIENDGKHRPYTGRNRNVGDVLLTIERYYLIRNKMSIHITFLGDPKGEQRGSSLIASLKKAKRQTDGEFKTTAADASGLAVFQDDKFKEISSKK
ncbi:MAG: hypothetical protein GY726_12205 [Proteobacteria bacterium]|nr:hypothetical protein [Pseudomonadota bacterium]MCP4081791.1 hypothetical protein [Planctomycetaceae bacterium]